MMASKIKPKMASIVADHAKLVSLQKEHYVDECNNTLICVGGNSG
jgi:hypothetical protein